MNGFQIGDIVQVASRVYTSSRVYKIVSFNPCKWFPEDHVRLRNLNLRNNNRVVAINRIKHAEPESLL